MPSDKVKIRNTAILILTGFGWVGNPKNWKQGYEENC